MNYLCMGLNCWIYVMKGGYPRFHSSTSERTSKSRKELDKTDRGFTAVHMHGLNLSNLVPKKENICGDAIKAMSKIARLCLFKEHITLHCKLNIKS